MDRFSHRPWFWVAIVFCIAIAVRVPSCYQSFWVDELHSAWCIWDSFHDIAPRAKQGNQSPVYFVGLWFWKQVFGGSEITLRMSSVLMTSIAAGVMMIGVSRWTRSVIAGTASGLVMALESNAIFFGTELRPYSVVILCSSIATLSFVRLWEYRESMTAWTTLVISTLIAAIVQPTAIGVLSMFFVAIAIRRIVPGHEKEISQRKIRRHLAPRMVFLNGLLATMVIVTAGWLWDMTLASSWGSRRAWATFAMAPDLWRAIGIWDWVWLWLLPLGVVLWKRPPQKPAIVIAIIILVATGLFYSASKIDWVHLWHRRYFIGLLPMFAMLVGASVERFQSTQRRNRLIQIAYAVVLVLGLTSSQGVAVRLIRNPDRLAYRGEDWRSAVLWVQSERRPGDPVWLDPGLIESRILTHRRTMDSPPTNSDLTYLRYPVSGPYRLSDVQLISPIGKNEFSKQSVSGRVDFDANRPRWVIARASLAAANRFATKISRRQPQVDASQTEVKRFGGVCVIRFPIQQSTPPLATSQNR